MTNKLLSVRNKKITFSILLMIFSLAFVPAKIPSEVSIKVVHTLSIAFIILLTAYRTLISRNILYDGKWFDSFSYKLFSLLWILIAIERILDIFVYKQTDFSLYQAFILTLHLYLIVLYFNASKNKTIENTNEI